MAPLAVQRSRTRTGILSPGGRDRIVPVACGVDDSRRVAGYAGREIDGMGVRAITLSVHKIRARLKRVKGRAIGSVGALGKV